MFPSCPPITSISLQFVLQVLDSCAYLIDKATYVLLMLRPNCSQCLCFCVSSSFFYCAYCLFMLTFKLVCSQLSMIKKGVLSNLVLVMDIGASSYQCRNKVITTLVLVGICVIDLCALKTSLKLHSFGKRFYGCRYWLLVSTTSSISKNLFCALSHQFVVLLFKCFILLYRMMTVHVSSSNGWTPTLVCMAQQ